MSDIKRSALMAFTSGQARQLTEAFGTQVDFINDITASAAELNVLDGVTASTAELNTLDGYTGTTNELNLLDSSSKFVLMEDFYGTWAIGDAGPADTWSTTAGAGTATEVATTVAGSLNGLVTMKSASDDGTNAQNSTLLTGINLGFKANQGGLAIEARLKVDEITAVAIFVGFTDTISTTVELPIFLAAADLDSDATDACGIIFDTDATTDEWCHGGVKAGTDTTPAFSGSAPVADTFVVLRVEVSAAGAVQGFINGTAIGAAVANAVTATTALTPCVAISNRGAAQRVLTLDYIRVEQNR
jgi:hypothetical protein